MSVNVRTSHARGLRQRWNRTFGLLIVVLLVCGAASLASTAFLVNNFRASAIDVERDSTISARLRADVLAHAVAVTIPEVDQNTIDADRAATNFDFNNAIAEQDNNEARALLRQAFSQWQGLVTVSGPDAHAADIAAVGAEVGARVPQIEALMDQASSVGRAADRAHLAHTSHLVRWAMLVLAALSLLGVALVAGLARRLSSEVLQPVGLLRDSANHLAAGELDHRIAVDRSDEIGELAISFNAMADAIAGSHRTLAHEASTDSLSGLANRGAFRSRLAVALGQADRRSTSQAALFVDLDDFKDVNDTLGHDAGDALLSVVAERLAATIRPGDLVARLGGDEFALFLDNLADPAEAFTVAERVVTTLSDPVLVSDHWTHVGASVGVAMVRDDSNVESLMREADVAMYAAKANGKNRVEGFDATLDDLATIRLSLRGDLDGAAERGELVAEYQPAANLDTGLLVGFEALVRWQHPTRGLLPPSSFIELAETTGAILSIGNWMLETALTQLRRWQDTYRRPDLVMSVNVSMCQLDSPTFADHVLSVLRATGVDPNRVVLEVTESVLADPGRGAAANLTALRLRGIKVALDDFGTGYSSLAYLQQLPVDAIKVDRSFVSGPDAGGGSANALLEAIVAMGEHLGLDIIPEGIEEPEQLERLRAMGCHVGQGFYLARPASAEAAEVLLATTKPWPKLGRALTPATRS